MTFPKLDLWMRCKTRNGMMWVVCQTETSKFLSRDGSWLHIHRPGTCTAPGTGGAGWEIVEVFAAPANRSDLLRPDIMGERIWVDSSELRSKRIAELEAELEKLKGEA